MDRFAYNMERTDVAASYNNYDNMHPINKCEVSLKNDNLWRQFHELDTEMIITKSGRRMFPALQVQISHIDPQAHYCIFLDMMPASRCRYKYSSAGGWAAAGSEEAQSRHKIYLHPESPATGEYWMSQPISFGRLKLTNMAAPTAGQVVLSSMHKYQPRIVIAQTTDPRTQTWYPNMSVIFPETQFIAVTAYQNEKITQLKIDNNPFAKGFRQNGQAKCKRKKVCEGNQEDEFICVTDEQDDAEHSNSALNRSFSEASVDSIEDSSKYTMSPRSRTSSDGDKMSTCHSPLSIQGSTTVKCANIGNLQDDSSCGKSSVRNQNFAKVQCESSTESSQNYVNPYSTNSLLPIPPTPYYPYFPFRYLPPTYDPACYYPYSRYHDNIVEQMPPPLFFNIPREMNGIDVRDPQKLTDFSIKSILGC